MTSQIIVKIGGWRKPCVLGPFSNNESPQRSKRIPLAGFDSAHKKLNSIREFTGTRKVVRRHIATGANMSSSFTQFKDKLSGAIVHWVSNEAVEKPRFGAQLRPKSTFFFSAQLIF